METLAKAFSSVIMLLARIVSGIQGVAETVWADFDDWLLRRGQTLPQFIGSVVRYIVVSLAVAFIIAGVGLYFGSNGDIDAGRKTVLLGMVIGLIMLAPFLILYVVARSLFDLIFHTGRVCAEILAEHVDVPDNLKRQLERMKDKSLLPFSPSGMLAAYLGIFVVLAMVPTSGTLYTLLLFGTAVYVLLVWGKEGEFKGWAFKHLGFAGAQAFVAGFLAYWVMAWLTETSEVQLVLTFLRDPNTRYLLQRLFGIGVGLALLGPLYKRTYSKQSEAALRSGDVRTENYVTTVHSLHTHDGQTVPHRDVKHPEQLDLGWIKLFGFIAVIVGAWFYWTQHLGRPNPMVGLWNTIPSLSPMQTLVLVFVLCGVLGAFAKKGGH